MPQSTSHATKAPAPGFWSSPRTQKRLLIGSSVVFVLGVIAFISVYALRGTSNAFQAPISNKPANLTKKEHTVPVDPKALATAREFMRTAVLRTDLSHAYDIVDSELKGNMTRKQWDTGNIPVIGYPANNINTTNLQVDYSYPTSMLLEVDLVAKKGSGVRPHLPFYLGLKRAGDKPGGRWLVNYWEANWRPPVPAAP